MNAASLGQALELKKKKKLLSDTIKKKKLKKGFKKNTHLRIVSFVNKYLSDRHDKLFKHSNLLWLVNQPGEVGVICHDENKNERFDYLPGHSG